MLALTALAAASLGAAASPRPKAAQPPPAAHGAPSESATEVEGVTVTAPKLDLTPRWASKLNLDPNGAFATPELPYLRQRPVNGCKVMAGGASHKLGKSGVASGMVCARAF